MVSFFTRATEDEKIIAGLQAGGSRRGQFEKELYRKFFYFIEQGSIKYKLQEDDAASAYSDTIIAVIDAIVAGRFEGRASLKSFSFQIFLNKCVDIVRKNTTNKSAVNNAGDIGSLVSVLPDKTKNVVQGLIEKNRKNVLMQKLNELGEKCKNLLLLFEDGYSDKEIAGMMDYNSQEVVKTSRLRCIEKLKQKVLGSSQL